MHQWLADLLDRTSEELDPNDRYSDWTGALEAQRHGPEKRELAAKQLSEAGRDAEVEAALEQADDCARAVYYFGYESAIVARMLANPRLQEPMLQAMAAVGVPFRGPARIPARVIAPLLTSSCVEAALELMREADFSEPASAIGDVLSDDGRLQAYAALAEHDWQRLSQHLDACTSEEALQEIVKILSPSQMQQMPGSKALARTVLETELASLRRAVSKAGDLAEKITSENSPAILDALFHRRFELASPPPYDKSNTKNAQAVLRLFQANPAAFAQALGSNAQRCQMLKDLFVKGLGYDEGLKRVHELDTALARKQ